MDISAQALACENFNQTLTSAAQSGIDTESLKDFSILIKQFAESTNYKSILVLNADKEIIGSWNYADKTITIPRILKQEINKIQSFADKEILWLIHSIKDKNDTVIGYGLLGINNNQFLDKLYKLANQNALLFGIISLVACILFILLSLAFMKSPQNITPRRFKLRLYLIFLVPLISAQCLFTFMLYEPLRNMEESNMHEIAVHIAKEVGQDVGHVRNLGLSIQQVQDKTAAYLMYFQKQLSWISGIQLTKDGYHLATSQEKYISESEWENMSSSAISWASAIYKPQTENDIVVDVLISNDVVTESLKTILWDTLSITVICFIFMTEILILLMLKEEQIRLGITASITSAAEFIRPIMFTCVFAISLCASFIPLRMREISSDFFGLQKNLVMGIPVSCEIFMMGFAIMVGGMIIPKIGWRHVLLWGIGIIALGNVISGLATGPLLFILGRCLAGMGYGFISLASQVFVLSRSSSSTRTRNLAFLISGCIAGILCGSAFGGLIADRLGQGIVFYVVAAYLIVAEIVLLCILKKDPWIPIETERQRLSLSKLKDFFTNVHISSLLMFNIFPCAFVSVCLLRFYIPISIDTAGGSLATIGRVAMFACLVTMYLAPIFGCLIDKSKNKAWWLSGAGLICAASVAVLPMSNGIWIVIVSTFLLSVCNAIISSSQGAYVQELPATTKFGTTHAITSNHIVKMIGQTLGPIILGLLIVFWGTGFSLAVIAIALGLMSVVFLVVNLTKPIKKEE